MYNNFNVILTTYNKIHFKSLPNSMHNARVVINRYGCQTRFSQVTGCTLLTFVRLASTECSNKCGDGHCCANSEKCCSSTCCDRLTNPSCCGNHCCTNSQKCCGDNCCSSSETCCGSTCCSKSNPNCCGDHCCTDDQKCCGSTCCDTDSPNCCGNHCCTNKQKCCGNTCCDSGTTCFFQACLS